MNKLILLLTLFCVEQSFAQNNIVPINEEIIDATFASYCTPEEPGLAVGIIHDGQLIYKNTAGVADLSNGIPVSDSTTFNIASVSKQFTALLTLLAVEEKKISLEDGITKYLPELKHLSEKITIKHLANHTHGLPNYSDLAALIGFRLETPVSNDEGVQKVLNIQQVNFGAGEQFQYGNTGFMLLAEILKRVYDQPFSSLVSQKIFEPLDMNESAVIDDPNTIIKNKAQAYRGSDGDYREYSNRGMEVGSSNVHSTLDDMIKWAMNYQNPKVGTRSMLEQMATPSTLKDGRLEGYGLGLYTGQYKGVDIVYHGGGTAGYRAYILHVPQYDLSIVTLGNKESFDGLLIVHELLDLYLGDDLVVPTPTKTTYAANELKAMGGLYEFQPGDYWPIRADENNLYFGGDSEPLPSLGDGKFEFPYYPTSYFIFYDGLMEFRIADMVYYCPKIELNPPVLSAHKMKKYVGVFKNIEFDTFYEIVQIDGYLVAKHLTNGEYKLQPLAKNTFYTGAPLGELRFEIDTVGEVDGFVLRGQNMENVKFVKLK